MAEMKDEISLELGKESTSSYEADLKKTSTGVVLVP